MALKIGLNENKSKGEHTTFTLFEDLTLIFISEIFS